MRNVHSAWLMGVLVALPAVAQIEPLPPVHLEFRPDVTTVQVGERFRVGYYAVSSEAEDLAVSNIEASLFWDPSVLRLVGRDNNGDYPWLFSGFSTLEGVDSQRLNDTWADGNAQYWAARLLRPDPPFWAAQEGTLITTLIFDALAETPSTMLFTPEETSFRVEFQPNHSRVFHGLVPGTTITGNLGSAEFRIVPEPTSAMLAALGSALFLLSARFRRNRPK